MGPAAIRISVYLGLTDVHVNRVPAEGIVLSVTYERGRHVLTRDPRASAVNQHGSTVLRSPGGTWTVKQIVGPLVRRISTWLVPGTTAARGQRLGLMKFGSRLDVTLPAMAVDVLVRVGDRVRAGETPIARWKTPSAA